MKHFAAWFGHFQRRLLPALIGVVAGATLEAQPAAPSSLVLGAEELVIPLGQFGLRFTPDEHMSYVRNPDGSARVFWAGGTSVGGGHTVAMDTRDFQSFTPVVASGGNAVAVLAPSGAGTTDFDADYAGASSVIRAANGRDLVMFYHAENHLFAGTHYSFAPFYASIGAARSADNGVTWARLGQIITGIQPHPSGAAPRDALGAGNPCVIAADGFLYLFYIDIKFNAGPDVIHVARAPLSSDGVPGAWQKWNNGAFSEPGLGGQSTPVQGQVAPGPLTISAGNPSVSFNTHLQKYVMVFQTNDGFYYSTSSNLTTWTVQERLMAFGASNNLRQTGQVWYAYPTLLSPGEPTEQTTTRTGYLYYGKGVWNQTSHTLYRRPFNFTAPVAPTIIGQPQSASVNVRGNATFAVNAYSPELSYQWQFNGAPIAGATGATLTLSSVGTTAAGNYSVVVSNSGGSVTSAIVTLAVNSSRLVNLSTRGLVPAGGALTPGFVMRGAGSKDLVIRAVGPTLGVFGIGGALGDPRLEIIPQGATAPSHANDDWGGSASMNTAFASVGAFGLASDSKDAAVAAAFAAGQGSYTVRITPSGGAAAGIALAEIYDADPETAATRLINVSTLGFSGSGENALAPGFVIRGTLAKRLLIRAVGPGIAQFGLAGTMSDPQLSVLPQGQSTTVGTNNDWGGTAALKAAFTAAGAFSLEDNSRDAALVLTLAPGVYSAVVTAGGNAPGVVLVEVYDID